MFEKRVNERKCQSEMTSKQEIQTRNVILGKLFHSCCLSFCSCKLRGEYIPTLEGFMVLV